MPSCWHRQPSLPPPAPLAGNLLENKELLHSLNETKSKSTTIAKSLTESKSLQISLDEQREVYR